MNNLLGFALPTNSPEVLRNILIPSLKNAQDLKHYCTWLINFQPPYTSSEIDETLSKFAQFGFTVKYTYQKYDTSSFSQGYVPVSKIRNDAARLMPDCKYFALIDDDMSFEPPSRLIDRNGGHQYLEGLDYMEKFHNCGVLLFRNLRRSVPLYTIRPVSITEPYYTGRGMIFRNIPEALITPLDSEWVLGGDEENIVAGCRLCKGLYVAEYHGVRVNHHEHRKRDKVVGQEVYGWYKWEVIKDNATKYIKEHYNPDYKGSQAIRGPGYKDDPNIVKFEDYIKLGGLNYTDSVTRDLYTLNYQDIPIEQLVFNLSKR